MYLNPYTPITKLKKLNLYSRQKNYILRKYHLHKHFIFRTNVRRKVLTPYTFIHPLFFNYRLNFLNVSRSIVGSPVFKHTFGIAFFLKWKFKSALSENNEILPEHFNSKLILPRQIFLTKKLPQIKMNNYLNVVNITNFFLKLKMLNWISAKPLTKHYGISFRKLPKPTSVRK